MLIIKIIVTNLELLTALNGGVTPAITSVDPTYLVIEGGVPNRIISHDELLELNAKTPLKEATRKFYYV